MANYVNRRNVVSYSIFCIFTNSHGQSRSLASISWWGKTDGLSLFKCDTAIQLYATIRSLVWRRLFKLLLLGSFHHSYSNKGIQNQSNCGLQHGNTIDVCIYYNRLIHHRIQHGELDKKKTRDISFHDFS